jgi:Nucleotidyl transferase AbiEii toxin, Type IV TA system
VNTPHDKSDWATLFREACSLIRQVNSEETIIDHWTFGGGTAMMLQINHRVSRDVDIFLVDPQLLGFLDPRTHDFKFEMQPTNYTGDGAGSLRLVFDDVGEIDFIVAQELTSSPTTATDVEGEVVLLETIPEIITKKIYYRGASIKPRDIFDIAAAGEEHANSLIEELRNYRQEVAQTLATMDKLNTDFVNAAIAELAIKDSYKEIAKKAIERSKEILRAV